MGVQLSIKRSEDRKNATDELGLILRVAIPFSSLSLDTRPCDGGKISQGLRPLRSSAHNKRIDSDNAGAGANKGVDVEFLDQFTLV